MVVRSTSVEDVAPHREQVVPMLVFVALIVMPMLQRNSRTTRWLFTMEQHRRPR